MAQFSRSPAEQFRPENQSVGWLWNIFVFSIVIFGSVILLYLGMEFGYRSFLQSQIDATQAQINEKKGQINADNQARLGEFYSQVYNLNKVLSGHPITSLIFKILEENTHVSVWYSSLIFSSAQNNFDILINGSANSLETIAKQLIALKKLPEIKDVSLNSAQYDKEKASYKFNIKIGLNPQYFRY